jgi:UDP-galactopyranose mutase
MKRGRVLVVGAGFSGATCARELADAGHEVTVVERRAHIGGNAYDTYDAHGVLVHPYGPHIFHTNSAKVVQWLSRFTDWRAYEHRVLAHVDGLLVPLPINRTTINRLYGTALDEAGVARFLEAVRQPRNEIRTSEDVVLNAVGPELCDKFFRGYTRKQWGVDLSELGPQVAARIPTRVNDDDRYFTDSFQAMPRDGFHALFARILEHPRIEVHLNTSLESTPRSRFDHEVYTGCVDAFFDFRFGPLPYRSLRFEHEHLPDTGRLQPVAVVNYPGGEPFTRITEFKHLTGQSHPGTSIVREFPCSHGDPYYPVPSESSQRAYERYRELADREERVTFVGRLAQYRYYNMDQAVAAALVAAQRCLAALEALDG